MADLFWGALGLMLVLEGALPFLSPGGWRQVFQRMLQMSDGQIRFVGLSSIGLGLVLLLIWAS